MVKNLENGECLCAIKGLYFQEKEYSLERLEDIKRTIHELAFEYSDDESAISIKTESDLYTAILMIDDLKLFLSKMKPVRREEMITVKWAKRFMETARLVSSWSKDPSTKVGAVLVTNDNRIISVGYNGCPRSCDDLHELYVDRERKYRRVTHAEINGILNADGRTKNMTLFCTHIPCSQCASAIIQAGIISVIVPELDREYMLRWADSIKESVLMFEEANVSLLVLSEENDVISLFNSEKVV